MRTFLQNIYQVNIDQIVTAVMNEYTDYRHTGENKMTNRDTLLDIFSDARVAAPVLKAASLHAEAKEANQAYLYVFKHVTKKGYYSEVCSTDILNRGVNKRGGQGRARPGAIAPPPSFRKLLLTPLYKKLLKLFDFRFLNSIIILKIQILTGKKDKVNLRPYYI